MWQHSVPSNQTNPTHQHNTSWDVDSPSDPLASLEEETLEFQVEYPQEAVEEVEEAEEEAEEEAVEEVSLLQHQHSKQLPMEETSLLAIRHLYSQEITQNRRHS